MKILTYIFEFSLIGMICVFLFVASYNGIQEVSIMRHDIDTLTLKYEELQSQRDTMLQIIRRQNITINRLKCQK